MAPAGYRLNKSSGTARHDFCDVSANYSFSYPHLRGAPSEGEGEKILVVGDSFTFGWLLNEERAYVSILQNLADKEFGPGEFTFLNAGTAGYGTAHYLRFIEDFGPKIMPDVVLVFLNTDDIGRSLESGLYELQGDKAQMIERARESTPKDAIKSFLASLPVYHWMLERSHLLQVVRTAFLSGRFHTACSNRELLSPEDPIPVPQSPELNVDAAVSTELGQALFRRLRDWCAEHNVDLLVVTTGWFAFADKSPSEPTNAFIQTASGFFGSEGIPFFDPTEMVEAQTTNAHALIWPGDDHPNEKGAELIASSVWGWLRTKLANHSGSGSCGTHSEESLNGVECFSSLQDGVDTSPVE